jgi:hypothetical protein
MTRSWLAAVMLASLALVGAGAQSWRDDPPFIKGLIPGWTGLVDPMGHCRFSVPPDWKVRDADRMAFAPDGAATAVEEWMEASPWTRYKAGVYGALKPTVFHEDSTRRLWIEYAAGWDGVHHHVAVPAPAGTCVLQIDVRARAAGTLGDVVRQVAESLIALP